MMGQYEGQKELLSYEWISIGGCGADHPLCRVQALIDFTFARSAVAKARARWGPIYFANHN